MVRIATMPIMSIIANADDLAMLQGVRQVQESSGMLQATGLHSGDADNMPDVVGTASMLQSIADRITDGSQALDPETRATLMRLAENLEQTQLKMDGSHARDDAHLGEIISNFTTGQTSCPDPRDHQHADFGNTTRDIDLCFRERHAIHTAMDEACALAHSELTNDFFLTLGASAHLNPEFQNDVAIMGAPEECDMPQRPAVDAHGHDSVQQHLDHMEREVEARKSAWRLCVQRSQEFNRASEVCENHVTEYEQAFCSERMDFLIACHDYEFCYAEKTSAFDSEWELAASNMADRKILNVHIETLKCMITALRQSQAAAVHASFETCKVNSMNTTWKDEQKERFHLDQSMLPENLECTGQMLEVTVNHPGTDAWPYKRQGEAFTSNEVVSRCNGAHTCDPVPAELSNAASLTAFLNEQANMTADR